MSCRGGIAGLGDATLPGYEWPESNVTLGYVSALPTRAERFNFLLATILLVGFSAVLELGTVATRFIRKRTS
jgi:hypothetical protein